MELAKLLTAGVDVWLNTPRPPLEAAGTSGMKAAINGVPSLGILEAGGSKAALKVLPAGPSNRLGERRPHSGRRLSLYNELEQVVIPLFYHNRSGFIDTMRHAIALNGSRGRRTARRPTR
jgi:glycogen phosphorylase